MNKFNTNSILLMLAPIFVVSSDFLVSKFTTQAAVGKFNQTNRLQLEAYRPGSNGSPIGSRYFNTKLKKFPVERNN